MKCWRNDTAFNNFIHDEKFFHAMIDFDLVSFTVTLSIFELRSLLLAKMIFGSSYILSAPTYSLISFACGNRGPFK